MAPRYPVGKGLTEGGVAGFYYVIQSGREKRVTKLNDFIIDYASYSTYNTPKIQNDGITLPPRVLLVTPPLHTSLRCGCLFLVGCCVSCC